jgi:hypothetical protein
MTMDPFDVDAEDDARDEIARLLRGEGLRVAVGAAIDVAGDQKAPAPARATAAGLLLRAAGMFDRSRDEGLEKEGHEMTPQELQRALANARRRLGRRDSDEG